MKRHLIVVLASDVSVEIAESQTDPPPIVRPGAPGETGRKISATEASDLAGAQYAEADVRFLQEMISHHEQALQLIGLASSRGGSEAVRTLAKDIELAEKTELQKMQEWLAARKQGATAPFPGSTIH